MRCARKRQYSARGPRVTRNTFAGIVAEDGGARSIMAVRANPSGDGRLALLRLGTPGER